MIFFFFFSSRRRHTRFSRDWSSDVCSSDLLDAIKQKPARVCPLVCEHGFKADGDRCVKIVCADGSFVNGDNECEKRRGKQPVAKRDEDDRANRRDRQYDAGRGAYGGGGRGYCYDA